MLSTTFDNNLAREVLYFFLFSKNITTVTGTPKKYSMYIRKVYLQPGSFHIRLFSPLFHKISFIRKELTFS